MRGYFGIGIYHFKHDVNIGGLMRSAFAFGASFIFTIGRKYQRDSSDTVGASQQIPLYHYQDFDEFAANTPVGCRIVGVELDKKSRELGKYCHPAQAAYLLGHESTGLPQKVMDKCHDLVMIGGLKRCLNVATAGSVVLFDRMSKGVYNG